MVNVMKGMLAGLIAVCLALLSAVPFLQNAYAQEADTDIWNEGVSFEDLGLVESFKDAVNPLCEYRDIKTSKSSGPIDYNDLGMPIIEESGRFSSEPISACVTKNQHGLFANDRYYSPTGDVNKFLEIEGSFSKYVAVPNGNAVLTLISGNYPGYRVAINYNFSYIGYRSVAAKSDAYDLTWKITSSNPVSTYVDGDPIIIESYAFSQNGRYAAFRYGSYFYKVDLDTQEMTPFYYKSSVSPINTLAISNDGRYVVTNNNSQFYIHDTANCDMSYAKGSWQKLTVTTGFIGCTKSQNYYSQILSVNSGFSPLGGIKFSPSGQYIELATRKQVSSTRYEYAEVRMSATGYSPNVAGYLAMGDSFTSGEGDTEGGTWYEPGTDEQGDKDTFTGRNLCHLSRRSYPYLMALELSYISTNTETPAADGLFHSVACSGAKTHNIVGITGEKQDEGEAIDFSVTDNQFRFDEDFTIGDWQPGATKQTNFLIENGFLPNDEPRPSVKPEIITVGVGGNDAGFGQKLLACLSPGTCEEATSDDSRSRVLIEIANEKQTLLNTYNSIKNTSPESRVYAIGYPVFVQSGGGTCGGNVKLDEDERYFVSQTTRYFNEVIKSAATEAGVTYVDIEDIFEGRNLCSGVDQQNIVVNGITLGNDIGGSTFDDGILAVGMCVVRNCIGNETYHPNPKGHELYKQAIMSATNGLTTPNPEPQEELLPIPSDYFGARAVNFVRSFIEGEPTGETVEEYKELVSGFSSYGRVELKAQGFLPGSIVSPSLRSDPIYLDEVTVDINGRISIEIEIPEGMTGNHEIHLEGVNLFGEKVHYYEPIQIAHSLDDFDGDGTLNDFDSCSTVADIGIDADNDGIDDACDDYIDITEPEEPETQHTICVVLATVFEKLNSRGLAQKSQALSKNPVFHKCETLAGGLAE